MLWGIPIIIGFILGIYLLVGVPYIADRFEVTFNPESDASGMGWLGVNRKIIINSAQLYGEADDMSTAIDLFDEGTGFAFISILAHYGWIVAILVTVSILLLSIKLIINAIKIKENCGKSLIIGISSMFILQSIFNILMNLNLWIESNYNLPFVSYGGVNLIINLMCLSLILSVLTMLWRDIRKLITSLMRMLMYFSPVIWECHFAASVPFHNILNIIMKLK